jgi:hypothetical protein
LFFKPLGISILSSLKNQFYEAELFVRHVEHQLLEKFTGAIFVLLSELASEGIAENLVFEEAKGCLLSGFVNLGVGVEDNFSLQDF